MRISVIENGGNRRLKHRFMFFMMRIIGGSEVPDVMKTLTYRPEFFGEKFSEITHRVLRGTSSWTVGQRELFAAFTAKTNRCVF